MQNCKSNQQVVLDLGEGQKILLDIGPLADVINEIGTNQNEHRKFFTEAIQALMGIHGSSADKYSAEEVLEFCNFLQSWSKAIEQMKWSEIKETQFSK